MLQCLLRNTEAYSLNENDLREMGRKINTRINVVLYSQLPNVSSINDLFAEHDAVILFYPVEDQRTGHWVALLKHGEGHFEFFDPYGIEPDSEIQFSRWLRTHKPLGPDGKPYLTHLLSQPDVRKLDINHAPLQEHIDNVNTCGTHCFIRIKYRDVPLSQYQAMFGAIGVRGERHPHGLNADQYVAVMAMPFLLAHHREQITNGC